MSATVRWNIAVSPKLDQSVRMFIAAHGGGRKGDLSRFIEKAVRQQLFEETVREIKAENAQYSAEEIQAAIDEALDWARSNR